MNRVKVLGGHLGDLVVFCGGSGMHGLVGSLLASGMSISFVLPVTDDGGSTAEIMRVLGGPAIGDLRNLLVRIAKEGEQHNDAISILSMRLNGISRTDALQEFMSIVSGGHVLAKLCSPKSDLYVIQAFLNVFLQSVGTTTFDFRLSSVGNCFLTGARLFFHNLGAAVMVCSRILHIPNNVKVLPVIESVPQCGVTLSLQMKNGATIRGQTNISYGTSAGIVDKTSTSMVPIPSEFASLSYVTQQEEEGPFVPTLNVDVTRALAAKSLAAIVYGRGSLLTSLIANLVVPGVGRLVSNPHVRTKILLINSFADREMRTPKGVMSVGDVLGCVVGALNQSLAEEQRPTLPASSFVTHVLYVPEGEVKVTTDGGHSVGDGVKVVPVAGLRDAKGRYVFDDAALMSVILSLVT